MTEQRMIVDVANIVLRLQCKCGSAVSVAPAEIMTHKLVKEALYLCPNCEKPFPGYDKSLLAGHTAQH